MTAVNGGGLGPWAAAIKPPGREVHERRSADDLRYHGAVHRHEGPELRRGLPGRLHLRCRGPVPDQPRGMYRLRGLRAGVSGRSDLPRGRGPRGPGELHRKERQLLRVEPDQTFRGGRDSGSSLLVLSLGYPGRARPRAYAAASGPTLTPPPFSETARPSR